MPRESTPGTTCASGAVSSSLLLAVLVAAWGCSPRLNWREVRPAGTLLQAQMPCRPSSHARRVMLAGQLREMKLLACSTDGSTWALAWIEGVEPAQLAATAGELRRLALANVDAGPTVTQPFVLAGSTPNDAAGRSRAAGRRPDGSPVTQDVAIFGRGTTVFQVTALSDDRDAQAVEHFLGALRFAS